MTPDDLILQALALIAEEEGRDGVPQALAAWLLSYAQMSKYGFIIKIQGVGRVEVALDEEQEL